MSQVCEHGVLRGICGQCQSSNGQALAPYSWLGSEAGERIGDLIGEMNDVVEALTDADRNQDAELVVKALRKLLAVGLVGRDLANRVELEHA